MYWLITDIGGWGEYAAVPMVEAMVALVLVDQLMAQYAQCEMFPINPEFQESVGVTVT